MSRARRASAVGIDLGRAYVEAMSHLAANVVVVMTTIDDRPWGMTISACCSVSARPPTLLISLGSHTASAAAIRERGEFGLSVLGQDGIDAARAGAAPRQPKFLEAFCRAPEAGAEGHAKPILRGAVAHLDCTVSRTVEVADHTLFIGEVADVVLATGSPPLLYWARDYVTVDGGEGWYA